MLSLFRRLVGPSGRRDCPRLRKALQQCLSGIDGVTLRSCEWSGGTGGYRLELDVHGRFVFVEIQRQHDADPEIHQAQRAKVIEGIEQNTRRLAAVLEQGGRHGSRA